MEIYREQLENKGHEVSSRWHTGDLGNPRLELDDPDIQKRAIQDLRDIRICDILIAFAANGIGRGGRHFEVGFAQGAGKIVFLIGEPEHAFHSLFPRFNSWAECFDYIGGLYGADEF